MFKQIAIVSLLAITNLAHATLVNSDPNNLVINGSFERDLANPLATFGSNVLATGWSLGDSGGLINGSDIINGDHNFGLSFPALGDTYRRFAAAPAGQEDTWQAPNSADGGSWVGLGRSDVQHDSIMQTINGFATGQRYRVSWNEANFGYVQEAPVRPDEPTTSYDAANYLSFILDNTTYDGDVLNVAQTWSANSFEFVSDRTGSYDLTIRLGGTDRAYLSLDGLSISAVSAVPEPQTWLMLMVGMVVVFGASYRMRTSLSAFKSCRGWR